MFKFATDKGDTFGISPQTRKGPEDLFGVSCYGGTRCGDSPLISCDKKG